MDVTVSEDHRMLVEAVRDYARGELIERDQQWDRTETSCCTHLDHFYEMGLMGLRVPEEDGGLECPMVPYAHIIRELAYASPSVSVTVSVHSMVAEAIRQFASEASRRRMLNQLATPGNLSAFAISEANAGSDPAAARVRAEQVEGGWKLYGEKMWVTNGITGRWFAVLARSGDGGASKDLSMLLMDAQQDGVERRPIKGKMGIRASETAEMSLDGAFVPEDHLLGDPGDGLKIALSALDGGRLGIAAQAIGIGQACLDIMSAYAKQREQFGQPIANFQAIQWMIADSATELSAGQLLTDRAAWLKSQDQPFTKEASMAKLYASEAANRIAYRAVQIHGGYGYVNEFRVEQLYRDARITTIYEGTSEIQRHVIARDVLSGS
ncbi:MAG TPA: acyl-CoA dehydrogenase family protein [Phycisphaerae bacterium]|nr:acyl-CoA dehydrogenase family protein [Phycisphaerae bacterium]